MLRCVAVIYASLSEISGYCLRDDATKKYAICTVDQTYLYVSNDRVINLTLHNDQIICKDCAIGKMPRYTEGGFCLDEKPVYQVISRSEDGNSYVLLQAMRELRFSKSEVQLLLKSDDVTVCNAYLVKDSIAVNSTETLISSGKSQPTYKSIKFAIPDETVTWQQLVHNARIQQGIVAAFLIGKGFLPEDISITTRNQLIKDNVQHSYFAASVADKKTGTPICFSVDMELSEDDPMFQVSLDAPIKNNAYNYMIAMDMDKELNSWHLINSSNLDAAYTFIIDDLYSYGMDDSSVPEALYAVIEKLQRGLSKLGPVSVNNMPSVAYCKSLYDTICKAVDEKNWSKVGPALYAVYHHRISITGFGFNILLELSLAQNTRDCVMFNRGKLKCSDDISREIYTHLSLLNEGKVFDDYDLTRWCS